MSKELLTEENPDRWEPLVERFQSRTHRRYRTMIFRQLLRGYALYPAEPELGGPTADQKARAQAMLKRFFLTVDWYRPPAATMITSGEIAGLLRAAASLPSDRIDREALRLFRAAVEQRLGPNVSDPDTIALGCIDRLTGKNWDAELARHCRRRIRELEKKASTPQDERTEGEFRERLRLLDSRGAQ